MGKILEKIEGACVFKVAFEREGLLPVKASLRIWEAND